MILRRYNKQDGARPRELVSQPVEETLNHFAPLLRDDKNAGGIQQANVKANEVVSDVFSQAIVHTVAHDENAREKILGTAKKVINDKTQSIADTAHTESKLMLFKRHEDACSGFGYEETTTPKSLVKIMGGISYFWSLVYILTLGTFIVFPITFFCRKIRVVIKKTWLVFVLALVVYLIFVVGPVLLAWLLNLL